MNSTTTSLQGGSAGSVFKAAAGDPSPAVIILPAIAGLNPYIDRMSDALADQGYASVAMDYYARSGGVPDLSDRAKIMAAVASLSDRDVLADIEANVEFLKSRPNIDGKRISVMGFCVGGSFAILAASEIESLACAIGFYGTIRYGQTTDRKPVSPLDAAQHLKCPLLAHYGEQDPLIPQSDVEALRSTLKSHPAEIYSYPGAGHAFHEDYRPEVYRPIAAQEAWRRSLAYLDWYRAK